MSILKLPRSVRKYIRFQKSLIRRGVLDMAEQSRLISKLYENIKERQEIKEVVPQKKVIAPIITPKPQEPVSSKKKPPKPEELRVLAVEPKAVEAKKAK